MFDESGQFRTRVISGIGFNYGREWRGGAEVRAALIKRIMKSGARSSPTRHAQAGSPAYKKN